MMKKYEHSAIAFVVSRSSQTVSSLSGRDRFPSVPTNCLSSMSVENYLQCGRRELCTVEK